MSADYKAMAAASLAECAAYSDPRNPPNSAMQEAMVAATLYAAEQTAALVEQQRVANLIALFHLEDADVADLGTRGVIWPQVSAEIVAGLGLA